MDRIPAEIFTQYGYESKTVALQYAKLYGVKWVRRNKNKYIDWEASTLYFFHSLHRKMKKNGQNI